jgi:hypothetical protein
MAKLKAFGALDWGWCWRVRCLALVVSSEKIDSLSDDDSDESGGAVGFFGGYSPGFYDFERSRRDDIFRGDVMTDFFYYKGERRLFDCIRFFCF